MPSSKNGKKQNTGVYFTNGIHYRPTSHRYFTPGTRVIYNKTGEVGIVVKKMIKCSRSLICVQFDDIRYINSKLLHLVDYYSTEQKKQCSKCIEYRNNKNNKKKDKLSRLLIQEENKKKIKNFVEYKKKFRKEILDNGLYIAYTDNKSKYSIKNITGNELIDNINKLNLEKIMDYDKKVNSISSLSVNESRIPKEMLLNIYYFANGKSSQNLIPYINTKSEYYEIIEKYRLSLINE